MTHEAVRGLLLDMATTTPTQTLDLLGDTLDRLITDLHEAKAAARSGERHQALGILAGTDDHWADVQALIRVLIIEQRREA